MENEKKLKFNPDDMIAAADEQFLEWMKNGRYAELIDTMPNLGRYSLRNQMLILMQNPKATCVNGMNAWNYKRRHIEKGQTSIRIIAPKFASQVSTDKDGNITEKTLDTVTGYEVNFVYDVSQTAGEPVKDVFADNAAVDRCDTVATAIKGAAKGFEFKTHEKTEDESHGILDTLNKTISVRADLSKEDKTRIINSVAEIGYAAGAMAMAFNEATQAADSIEGRFLNVTAVPTLRENIDKCFEQVGLKIASHTISALALGDSILSESERRSGCALVDMGADTTTVAIYKNNILRQLSVIPLGGSNVTKDIMTLQLERDEAEQLKLKHGTAYAEFADDEEPSTITLSDGRTVDELTFLELTEARIEEIVINVASQIKRSGYAKDKLLAGIIITGGVAATKNLERAFREHTDFEQFRFAKNLPITIRLPQGQESVKLGNVNTVIALVDKGIENCCGTPATATIPADLFSGHESASKDTTADAHPHHGQKADTTTKPHGKESDEDEEDIIDEKPRKKKQKKTHDGPTFKERCSKFWQSISRIVTDDSDPNLLDKDKNQ